MFPVQAKCVAFEGAMPAELERAREALVIGEVYTVRNMFVGQCDSHLEFYEIPGQWSTVFFDGYIEPDDEEYDESLCGNDEEIQ